MTVSAVSDGGTRRGPASQQADHQRNLQQTRAPPPTPSGGHILLPESPLESTSLYRTLPTTTRRYRSHSLAQPTQSTKVYHDTAARRRADDAYRPLVHRMHRCGTWPCSTWHVSVRTASPVTITR